MSWHPKTIELPDGTKITWEQFCEAYPTEYITAEIDKEIIEKLAKTQAEKQKLFNALKIPKELQ